MSEILRYTSYANGTFKIWFSNSTVTVTNEFPRFTGYTPHFNGLPITPELLSCYMFIAVMFICGLLFIEYVHWLNHVGKKNLKDNLREEKT